MKRFALLGLAAALVTSPLSAQTLLNDTFNTENGGNSALNYSSFANWTVNGQVDLVKNGDFGISCFGGNGLCVDLDGSSGPGWIMSQYFSFNAGQKMKFSMQLSGNQRSLTDFDDVELNLMFAAPTTFGNYMGTGGWNGITGYFGIPTTNVSIGPVSVAGNAGFSLWTFEFEALTSGSVQYTLGSSSADNVGPIADNIMVERTTVTPEPSTWAMLAFGMGAVGFAARRRQRNA